MNTLTKTITFRHPPSKFFTYNEVELPFKIADVMPAVHSEILPQNNLLFTFIAQKALGRSARVSNSLELNSFITPDGIMVSVVSLANVKVSKKKSSSKILLEYFERKVKLELFKEFKLKQSMSDIYVLCELDHTTLDIKDPTELSNWNFYVTEGSILKSFIANNNFVNGDGLSRLPAMKSNFIRLKKTVYCVAHSLQLSY